MIILPNTQRRNNNKKSKILAHFTLRIPYAYYIYIIYIDKVLKK